MPGYNWRLECASFTFSIRIHAILCLLGTDTALFDPGCVPITGVRTDLHSRRAVTQRRRRRPSRVSPRGGDGGGGRSRHSSPGLTGANSNNLTTRRPPLQGAGQPSIAMAGPLSLQAFASCSPHLLATSGPLFICPRRCPGRVIQSDAPEPMRTLPGLGKARARKASSRCGPLVDARYPAAMQSR